MLSYLQRHEVEDDALAPLEVASRHLGSEFRDPISVLKGARHMVSLLLLCVHAENYRFVNEILLPPPSPNLRP